MRNKEKGGVIIIIIMLLVIFYYWYAGSQLGIGVSCENKKILGILQIPPPLMNAFQPTLCQVELKATINDSILCFGKISISNFEKGIFPCSEIKKYPNEMINVSTIFYDSNGNQETGRDNQSFKYSPKLM